jgi:cobalamin biosynthesis protein CobT
MDYKENNVDCEWVEFAGKRLMKTKNHRKIMIVFTDGFPITGNGRDSDRIVGNHLVKVCNTFRKNGIEIYAFGIETESPEKFYGKDFFIYLDDLEKMGEKFFRQFASIISAGKIHF